jgi:hypothetical protein
MWDPRDDNTYDLVDFILILRYLEINEYELTAENGLRLSYTWQMHAQSMYTFSVSCYNKNNKQWLSTAQWMMLTHDDYANFANRL